MHDVCNPGEVLTAVSGAIAKIKKNIRDDVDTELITSEDNIKKGRVHSGPARKHKKV